jgi:phosphatidylinositol glycan class O
MEELARVLLGLSLADLTGNWDVLWKAVRIWLSRIVFTVVALGGIASYAWFRPIRSSSDALHGTKIVATVHGSEIVRSDATTNPNSRRMRHSLFIGSALLAILQVQKPMGVGTISLMSWQISSLLEIIRINHLNPSPIGPYILFVLGNFYFFKTGHQAALSFIQWSSAFIPFPTVHYPCLQSSSYSTHLVLKF